MSKSTKSLNSLLYPLNDDRHNMLHFLFTIHRMPHILTVNSHLILHLRLLFQFQWCKHIHHLISAGLNQDVWRFQLSKLLWNLIHRIQHCPYWSWNNLSCVVSFVRPYVLIHLVFVTVGEFGLDELERREEISNGLAKLFHDGEGLGDLAKAWCKECYVVVFWGVSYCHLETYRASKTQPWNYNLWLYFKCFVLLKNKVNKSLCLMNLLLEWSNQPSHRPLRQPKVFEIKWIHIYGTVFGNIRTQIPRTSSMAVQSVKRKEDCFGFFL